MRGDAEFWGAHASRVPGDGALAIANFSGYVSLLSSFRTGRFGGAPKRAREGAGAPQNQSAKMTHMLEGERPGKRLSYIGATCVAGQRNVPAAVARAKTE
jgi:hypothetical protein